MRIRALGALAMLLIASVPVGAQAHERWGHERSDHGRSFMHELRQACDWGNRRACVRLGREIEQRREARREWGHGPGPHWQPDPWRGGHGAYWQRGW